jgi:hypothetical protein
VKWKKSLRRPKLSTKEVKRLMKKKKNVYLHFIKKVKDHICYSNPSFLILNLSIYGSWGRKEGNWPNLGCGSRRLTNSSLGCDVERTAVITQSTDFIRR